MSSVGGAGAARPQVQRPPRLPGIDLARGLAVLLMIETHAYDGWVTPAGKQSAGYALTRVLSSIPSALFLLLAGVGLSFGFAAAVARGQEPRQVRAVLARRGLWLVAAGYGVSLLYAAVEGPASARVADLLRADILHCIGLSLALCAVALLTTLDPGVRARRAAVLCLVGTLAQPLLQGMGALQALREVLPQHGPLQIATALVALLVDVPPFTRFPLLPLCAFTVLGVVCGDWLQRRPPPPLRALGLGLGSALLATLVTVLLVQAQQRGVVLNRAQPLVALSMLNQGGRALSVLLLALALPQTARLPAWLLQLGRGSLLAYAFHIPLCYGRLARPFSGRLGMAAATLAVVGLYALTYGVVAARDYVKDRRARRGRAV